MPTPPSSDAPHHEPPAFGHPDEPGEGWDLNKDLPRAVVDPGPQNRIMAEQFPDQTKAPPTDISTQPFFWSSFNISPRRQQEGGWARELTQKDFALSSAISGVNMRLDAGGIRELHWHQTAEWAIMTYGKCRITTIDAKGRPSVEDLEAGDLWYFPAGLPHSLQGLGPDGAEFVLAFDDGEQSESNTLLLTDVMAHMPPEVLAKNFGVSQEVFAKIPLHNLWIFQGEVPGDLEADRSAAGVAAGAEPVIFRLSRSQTVHENSGGHIQIADSSDFHISKTVAAALVTVQPGGMREIHWHPNADEWQYYIRSQGRMTVVDTGPKATTNDFKAGDVGVVKKNLAHYVKNTGDDVLQFVEIFKAAHYEEVSLAQWLGHVPPELVSQHLNIDAAELQALPKSARGVTPLQGEAQA